MISSRVQQMCSSSGKVVAGRRARDLDLLVFRRVVELDQEHEPVELRFGQRIRAFLLDRVLRRQHEERRLELERLADDRDAAAPASPRAWPPASSAGRG